MISNNLILIENNEVKFSEYLANHPHLYDGIDLSGNEIETINRHFWDYTLKEKDFSNHYLEKLSWNLRQYHLLAAQEFVDKIGDITTNKEILKIAGHVASNGSSTSSGSSSSTNSMGQRTTDNKSADRQLPMKTTDADDIDELVNWEDGASGIGENKSVTSAVTDSISATDTRNLTNLSSAWNTNDSERTVIGQQAVKCIENIWNYLAKPKAMDWLCDKLESCFILVL